MAFKLPFRRPRAWLLGAVAVTLTLASLEPAAASTISDLAATAGSATRSSPILPVPETLLDGATSALVWAGFAVFMISAQGVWTAVRANKDRARARRARHAEAGLAHLEAGRNHVDTGRSHVDTARSHVDSVRTRIDTARVRVPHARSGAGKIV